MDESEFWLALEHRLCKEFAGMTEGGLHKYWCDGISPSAYLVTEQPPQILGYAWICEGAKQSEWKFEFYLPAVVASRDQINWQSLLPPEDATRWLAVDENRRMIQIEPAAAVPDLS